MEAGVATPGRRSAGRRLADLFHGRPRLQAGSLLAGPVGWLVVGYLGSLAVLLVTSFWTLGELSGEIERTFTLDNFKDVVTEPAEKSARLQGDAGFVEWRVNHQPGKDAVISGSTGAASEELLFAKTRADDFKAEIDHLSSIMEGGVTESPIALDRGLDTMMVIAAAFRSHALGRRVAIDWTQGYVPEAIT